MFFTKTASGGIPRGLASSGPAVLSYGFRPFFLLAGIWAIVSMILWVLMLAFGLPIGANMAFPLWHAHEMVLGYTSAVLAGFMLTAIPNWTGRLPVSGPPLLGLVLVWVAGRLVMMVPDIVGVGSSLVVEGIFLPLLTLVALREIIAGKNWKNLKIVLALATLSAANMWFWLAIMLGQDASIPVRAAVGTWIVLIALIGGRIIPSFTRNWMSRRKFETMPASFGRYDQVCVAVLALALCVWVIAPVGPATATVLGFAVVLNLIRLVRWKGYLTASEPIVAVLHVAYLFVLGGLAMMTFSALLLVETAAAMHVLLVGGLGGMTLAVMTRASLGHTGRAITAGVWTLLAYGFVFLAALARPLVVVFPHDYTGVLFVSALFWVLSFTAFTIGFAPVLCSPRMDKSTRKQSTP